MSKRHIISTLFPAALFPAAVLLASAAWAVPPQESPMSHEPENMQQSRIPEDQALQSEDVAASAQNNAVHDPTTATGTPAVSMAAIKSNFDAFDKNGDGYISKDEAAADPHLTAQFNTLDADHDGKLSVTEFMSAANVAEFRPQRGLERE